MGRRFARFNISIWQDDEYRALPFAAQWLYQSLWMHPELSYCGVVRWRPGLIAALSDDLKAADIHLLGDCLEARHFIVRDDDTEECLVRSWVRFDGLLSQPRMAVSYANAFANVGSADVRGVIVSEAQKLRDREPTLVAWQAPSVLDLLSQRALSAKDRTTPDDPYEVGFDPGLHHRLDPSLGVGLGQTEVTSKGSVSGSPTPSPSPTPLSPTDARKRAHQRPADWQPNDQHRKFAADNGIFMAHEFEQFKDHHDAKGTKFKDWDAGFRTWLRNAVKFSGGGLRVVGETAEQPPQARDPNAWMKRRPAAPDDIA